jgi:hypothetical protein
MVHPAGKAARQQGAADREGRGAALAMLTFFNIVAFGQRSI